MDDDYIFQTICTTYKDTILEQYAENIQRLKSTHISMFSVDILSYVLSFCTLGDVLPIKLVCKQWNRATENKTFWKRLVMQRFVSEMRDYNIVSFDNFCFPQETLRDQTEWLFKKKSREYFHCGYYADKKFFSYWFERASRDSHRAEWAFNANGTVVMCTIGECKRSMANSNNLTFVKNGRIHEYYSENVGFLECIYDYKDNRIVTPQMLEKVVYKADDGTLFKGQGVRIKNRKYVHGEGEWTFPDGSTLKGKDVAFCGKAHGIGVDQDGNKVEYFAGNKKRKISS